MSDDMVSEKDVTRSDDGTAGTCRYHLVVGWWGLLVFVLLGGVLECLHGYKVAWYVNSGEPETTRLMWRLAHAHGTMLSLIHLGFAWSVTQLPGLVGRARFVASRCLLAAGILIPAGFFLGGWPAFVLTGGQRLGVLGGDPGLSIVLVPLGAGLLLVSIGLTARASLRS